MGQAEEQKLAFWRTVLQWTMGFAGVTPGHKVELLQPKAEGREVFKDAEEKADRRAMMRIAGQIVTSLGGPGFANAEVFATIASFLLSRTAQDLAGTLNEQAIPPVLEWAKQRGYIRSSAPLTLAYDTTPPQSRKAEAEAIEAAMKAFVAQWEAAEKSGDESLYPSVDEYRARFRLPVAKVERDEQVQYEQPANENGEQEPDFAAKLAAEMTAHKMPTCEHGYGRCWRCGVERDRGIEIVDGQRQWRTAWRPLRRAA